MEKSDTKLGRRRALQMLGVGVAAGGLFVLEACKGGGSGGESTSSSGAAVSAGDCTQDIDDNSETLRRTLQYHAKAVDPAKHCSACAQFIDGKYADCGGGCKVIPGPVKPNGGCLSFAPKAAGAAPSSSG